MEKSAIFSLILAIFAPKISYLQGFGGRTDRNPNPREDKKLRGVNPLINKTVMQDKATLNPTPDQTFEIVGSGGV